MKRMLTLTTAMLALGLPALAHEHSAPRTPLPPGTTMSEKLTYDRKDGDSSESKTRERSFSTAAPAQPPNQPVIIINNQLPAPAININNNNTNTNPVNVTSSLQSQVGVETRQSPQVLGATPRPRCSFGVVTNLGFDQFGRPIFANVRTGPGVQFGSVTGPDLTPVLLPDGVKVAVCSRQGRWLGVEIPTANAPIQGWVFERYVGVL